MRDQDHKKTACVTPLGLFEFNRMTFGLNNAPSMGDFNFETMLVYLDNIIIFSKTFEDHVKYLDWVLVKNTKNEQGRSPEP